MMEIASRHPKYITSQKLIEELRIKIQSKKFRKYFSISEVIFFIESIKEVATICNLTFLIDICRDSKDNYLLAIVKDAKAGFLITGNKDLFVIKQFEITSILTLTEFLSHLSKI